MTKTRPAEVPESRWSAAAQAILKRPILRFPALRSLAPWEGLAVGQLAGGRAGPETPTRQSQEVPWKAPEAAEEAEQAPRKARSAANRTSRRNLTPRRFARRTLRRIEFQKP